MRTWPPICFKKRFPAVHIYTMAKEAEEDDGQNWMSRAYDWMKSPQEQTCRSMSRRISPCLACGLMFLKRSASRVKSNASYIVGLGCSHHAGPVPRKPGLRIQVDLRSGSQLRQGYVKKEKLRTPATGFTVSIIQMILLRALSHVSRRAVSASNISACQSTVAGAGAPPPTGRSSVGVQRQRRRWLGIPQCVRLRRVQQLFRLVGCPLLSLSGWRCCRLLLLR